MKPYIIVAEDEDALSTLLSYNLEKEGYDVGVATDGDEALVMVKERAPDLLVCDWMMPKVSGIEVCRRLRQQASTRNLPIVMLTARSEETDRIRGLDTGADDYVTKPFSAEVLLARINANLRKSAVKEVGDPEIVHGPIRMDLVRHEVFIDDERIGFTPKEYDLLRFFLVNRGRMLTHKQILKEVWGPAHLEDTQYLRVYIGQVRDKLETRPGLGKSIVSESGIGYRMDQVA